MQFSDIKLNAAYALQIEESEYTPGNSWPTEGRNPSGAASHKRAAKKRKNIRARQSK